MIGSEAIVESGMQVLVLAAAPTGADGHSLEQHPCLVESDGRTLLERIVSRSPALASSSWSFAFLERDIRRFHLDRIARLLVPGARVVRVAEGCRGAACTALLAASDLKPQAPMLVLGANEWLDVDLAEVVAQFEARGLDAGALVFPSLHPRYSYVALDDAGLVREASQRTPISRDATTGTFWFRRAGDFAEAAKNLIRKQVEVEGLYFIAPCLNELVLDQRRIGVHRLARSQYLPVKDERQSRLFEEGAPA